MWYERLLQIWREAHPHEYFNAFYFDQLAIKLHLNQPPKKYIYGIVIPQSLPCDMREPRERLAEYIVRKYEEDNRKRNDANIEELLGLKANDKELPDTNFIINTGKFCEVSFQHKKISLKYSKGLRYIAYLLKMPNKEISALDMHNAINLSNPAASRLYDEELSNDLTDGIDQTDKKTIFDIGCRLKDLNIEIEEAENNNDVGAVKKLKHEKDRLYEYLNETRSYTGKSDKKYTIKKVLSVIDKISNSTGKAIGREIKNIRKYNDQLGQHLDNSIHTGRNFSYKPSENISWTILNF